MERTKDYFMLIMLVGCVSSLLSQDGDTILVQCKHLDIKGLKKGKATYVVYNKKSRESSAERITIVKISVVDKVQNEKPAVSILQQWERDTVIHTAETLLNAEDFTTIFHKNWWKRLGYIPKLIFTTQALVQWNWERIL